MLGEKKQLKKFGTLHCVFSSLLDLNLLSPDLFDNQKLLFLSPWIYSTAWSSTLLLCLLTTFCFLSVSLPLLFDKCMGKNSTGYWINVNCFIFLSGILAPKSSDFSGSSTMPSNTSLFLLYLAFLVFHGRIGLLQCKSIMANSLHS